jgi:hypothetical protein
VLQAVGESMKREQAEDVVVRNLVEALNRLQQDLDRIELWTQALHCFQHAAPDYQPRDDYLLSTRKPPPR